MTRRVAPFVIAGAIAALVLATSHALSASSWRWSKASAYSTADSPGVQGCTGRALRDDALTFASLAVPCGARVRFCSGRRCVTAKRTDSGPYVAGRTFDLAVGTVRALGFSGTADFGVRAIRWRRV